MLVEVEIDQLNFYKALIKISQVDNFNQDTLDHQINNVIAWVHH